MSRPYFDEEGAACAQWLSERYIAPLSSCVRLFTPPGGVPRMVRAQGGYWRLEEPTVGEVDDRWVVPGPALADFEPRKNAVKQASIAAALERGELRVAELTAEFGAVSSPPQGTGEAGRRAHRAPPPHAGDGGGLRRFGAVGRLGRRAVVHPLAQAAADAGAG